MICAMRLLSASGIEGKKLMKTKAHEIELLSAREIVIKTVTMKIAKETELLNTREVSNQSMMS